MIDFYDISTENQGPKDDFQLQNLGQQTVMAVIGKSVRGDWGQRSYKSETYFRSTNPEDYDGLFISKILEFKPTYDLGRVLDYHLDFYTKKVMGVKEKFLKHIKYVILPSIKERKNSEVITELVEKWLKSMSPKKKKVITNIKLRNVNAPTQVLVNSDNSVQNQNIQYNSADIKELLDKLTVDIEKLEDSLRIEFKDEIRKTIQQLKKNKEIKGRLLTIGEMIKDVGIGTFTNLISSPTFELLKRMLGLS